MALEALKEVFSILTGAFFQDMSRNPGNKIAKKFKPRKTQRILRKI